MKYVRKPKLKVVDKLEDIPAFASEDDEREWWATHDLSDALYRQLVAAPPEGERRLYKLKVSTRSKSH